MGTHACETAYICSRVANMYDYAKRIISFGRESVKLADQNIVLQGPVQDSICVAGLPHDRCQAAVY